MTAVHALSELGFTVRRHGDELHGHARVVPALLVPGTDALRTSVLGAWVDILTGLLTVGVVQPRVPVTLQLDIDLHRPPTGLREVHARARMVKAGEGANVAAVDLSDQDGERFGGGTGLFVVARDPALRMPADLDELIVRMSQPGGPLTEPLAERAGCEAVRPGVVALPFSPERSNASGTLNGGLIALLVEEAVLSERSGPPIAAMTLRYLRAVRLGPALATATVHGDVAEVAVTDAGRDDVLAVVATTRRFPAGLGAASGSANLDVEVNSR